jgi:hypothetical protein
MRLRQLELIILFIIIILAIGILLVVLPVEMRFFYKWGKDEHSLLIRLEFFQKRVGFGTKVFFCPASFKRRSRFIIPFCIGEEEERYKIRSFDDIVAVLHRYQKLLRYIREFIERSICRSFTWRTELGFADYALTGMATGLLWAGKGILLGYLNRLVKMDSRQVQVCIEPFFGGRRLESSVNCIITTHLGHIIIIFSRFIIWLINDERKKKKRGDRIWRTILSKP